MNIWTILNIGAWIASAVILLILLVDFLRVERSGAVDRGIRHDD